MPRLFLIITLTSLIIFCGDAAVGVERGREYHTDLVILTKNGDSGTWQHSTSIITFKSKGRIQSPGVFANAFRQTGQFTDAARTLAYNSVTNCALSLRRKFNLNIAQSNNRGEFLFSQCSENWRLVLGLKMRLREHTGTIRRRVRVEGTSWDSPIRITRKFLYKFASDGFPSARSIWLKLRTRGRQTCNSNNLPLRTNTVLNPFERDLLPSQIEAFASLVFGNNSAALQCEGGKLRLASKRSCGANIEVLSRKKITTLEKRFQIKKRKL